MLRLSALFCSALSRLRCRLNVCLPSATSELQLHASTGVLSNPSLKYCSQHGHENKLGEGLISLGALCDSDNSSEKRSLFRHSYLLHMPKDECWKGLRPFYCSTVLSTYQRRHYNRSSRQKSANKHTAMYAVAMAMVVMGLSYAAVPLYRIFCRASGYGGTVIRTDASEKVEEMQPIRERELTIRLKDESHDHLKWDSLLTCEGVLIKVVASFQGICTVK